MNSHYDIPATLKAISNFGDELDTALHDLPTDTHTGIKLSIHELLVNIVEHAYREQAGVIQITIKQSDDRIHVTLQDNADTPFDTNQETIPDPLALPEGGMGLFIIRQVFDNVLYERLEAGNRWQLTKSW